MVVTVGYVQLQGGADGFVYSRQAPSSTQKARVQQQRRTLRVSAEATGVAVGRDDSARPRLPTSQQDMVQQAAQAVRRAFDDGFRWQAVYLRNDAAFVPEVGLIPQVKDKSTMTKRLLDTTLPLVQNLTTRLFEAGSLAEVKTSWLGRSTAAMLYGFAGDPRQDVALLYLPGLSMITSDKMVAFFQGMADRLVVLVNPEQAQEPWDVTVDGVRDSGNVLGDAPAAAAEVRKAFRQQSYYCNSDIVNGWQTIIFHAYPYPWEVWVESLEGQLEQIGVSDERPGFDELTRMQRAYEDERGISPAAKMGKSLMDQVSGFSVESVFRQILQ